MGLIALPTDWSRQPRQPRWSALARRAYALVHTGGGWVGDAENRVIPMALASGMRPHADGAYLLGRNDTNGPSAESLLGRWNIASTQPASASAMCMVATIWRTGATANMGYLASWGESGTGTRCHVLTTSTTLVVSMRETQFATPRAQTYALTAGQRNTWAVRAVAGDGIYVWRDGELLSPSSSSGTMPSSALVTFTETAQPVWMGARDDFSALGAHYGQALWFEDLGNEMMRALSVSPYRLLHEPSRIWVPTASAAPSMPTLSLPTVTAIGATYATPRVTLTY